MVGWFGTLDELALKSEATEESPVPRNEVGWEFGSLSHVRAVLELTSNGQNARFTRQSFARVRL